MKVSIAMATYNGAQYIKEQLESFLLQSRLPDELIITDDCSTDDTVEIIREFAIDAPFPINLSVNEKNLGYAGNFNAALQKTTGDLIFLSDQDDVWFPDKLEYIAKLAEENLEFLVFMNNAALTDGLLNEVGLTKLGQIKSAGMTEKSFVMGCCCAIRRELLDICMPIPSTFNAHDNWIIGFSDGLKAKKVDDKVLQFYRRHESNESQFIANRTVKVTRKQAFLENLKGIFDKELPQREKNSIEQMQLLASGIKEANASEKHKESLEKFLADIEEKIKIQGQRVELRNKSFILRVPAVLFHVVIGGYTNKKIIKSAIRDSVGYPGCWFSSKKSLDAKNR